jgi:hypothetical protein
MKINKKIFKMVGKENVMIGRFVPPIWLCTRGLHLSYSALTVVL